MEHQRGKQKNTETKDLFNIRRPLPFFCIFRCLWSLAKDTSTVEVLKRLDHPHVAPWQSCFLSNYGNHRAHQTERSKLLFAGIYLG